MPAYGHRTCSDMLKLMSDAVRDRSSHSCFEVVFLGIVDYGPWAWNVAFFVPT